MSCPAASAGWPHLCLLLYDQLCQLLGVQHNALDDQADVTLLVIHILQAGTSKGKHRSVMGRA
jgi:hypothetical protein